MIHSMELDARIEAQLNHLGTGDGLRNQVAALAEADLQRRGALQLLAEQELSLKTQVGAQGGRVGVYVCIQSLQMHPALVCSQGCLVVSLLTTATHMRVIIKLCGRDMELKTALNFDSYNLCSWAGASLETAGIANQTCVFSHKDRTTALVR